MPDDPRLEPTARVIARTCGADPDTDWPKHLKAASGWLRNFDRAGKVPVVGKLRDEQGFMPD